MPTAAEITGEPVLNGLRTARVAADRWEALAACPLCGATDDLVDVAVVEAATPGPVIAACTACEFAFLRRRPSAQWVEEYYAGDWDETGRARRASKNVKPKVDPHVHEFCAPHLRPGATVLDAGAGFGYALLAFRQAGHEVEALEPSAHRARWLRERLDIPCRQSTLETATFDRPRDLVVIKHVLEHVADPTAAVQAAREALAADGLLYVAVPHLFREPAPQSVHYVPPPPLFPPAARRRLYARCGCGVVALDEGDEIQVLGRRTETPPDAAPADGAARARFRARLEDWVRLGFAAGPSHRGVVWFKIRTDGPGYEGYEVTYVPGRARSRLVHAAWRARQDDARWARRAWPLVQRLTGDAVSQKSFRMLPVRVAGEGLPVTVRQAGHDPEVWVK